MTFRQGKLRSKVKNETSSDKSGQFAPRKEPGAGSRPGQCCPEDRTGSGPRPASLPLLQGSTFLPSSSPPEFVRPSGIVPVTSPPFFPTRGENFTNKGSFFGKAKGRGEDSSTWLSERLKSKQTRRLWEAVASCPSSGWQLGNVRLT